MALYIGGKGATLGLENWMMNQPPGFQSVSIAATGEKVAFVGRFYHPDLVSSGGTKAVSRVGFQFGSVTKAGGSALTVSLQDTSLTSGPGGRPDETQDQTVAIANADGSFASSTWYRTGTLSANRTLSLNDRVCVVIEYDGSGRLGADTVAIQMCGLASGGLLSHLCHTQLKTGGSWNGQNYVPNLVLECNDGTFGTLAGATPISAFNSHAIKQDTASADEYAMPFTVPFNCYVDGAYMLTGHTAAGDCSLILYQGTSAMTGGTNAVDGNEVFAGGSSARLTFFPFTQTVQLVTGTQYYLAMQPTQTSNTVTIYSCDVNAAGHLNCWSGNSNWNYTTRVDVGSWAAATTTRRLLAGLSIAGVDSPGGGGPLVGPGRLVR